MAINVCWLLGALCILYGVLCQTRDSSERRVTISQGTVVGSATNGYFEFYGIPFADSTSGINRFKAPSAPPTFQDEFIANRKNIKCVRALGIGFEGTEDCLVVDVLTSSLDNTKRLPVMVWIKGKELDTDNNLDLSFSRFLERDVVVVSMNYRESILGFLCLGTESAPGNAGLKDIIAGLKWVQENIAAFGGDPDNVSLFGHGSGAAAIDLVTLSPMAVGLVHKAITQSGTALTPWAVTRNNLKYAVDVAEALGHSVSNVDMLSEVFSRTSVAALMAVINELDLTDNSLAFAPCVERKIENVEPLLLKSPYVIITEGEQLKIPFMTGFVDYEGIIRVNEIDNNDWLERMDNSFIDFLPPDIAFNSVEQEEQAANEIRTFYFRSDPIDESKINDFMRYNGDTMILVSAIREARMRTTSANSDVYLYQFSYKGKLSSEVLERPLQLERAGHKEELVYMFANDEQTVINSLDFVIGDILIERWTNFAKNGKPTSETSLITWQPFDLTNNYYLRILDDAESNENSDLEEELTNPHPQTMTFWNDIHSRFFADAVSRWAPNDRGEEEDNGENGNDGNGNGESNGDRDEDNGEGDNGNGDQNNGGEGNGDGGENNGEEDNGNGDEDNGEGDNDNGGEDNGNDSASTMVGYTFLIVSLFSILGKFHAVEVLS